MSLTRNSTSRTCARTWHLFVARASDACHCCDSRYVDYLKTLTPGRHGNCFKLRLRESRRCGIFKSFRAAIRLLQHCPASEYSLMNPKRLSQRPDHCRINPGEQHWRAATPTILLIQRWVEQVPSLCALLIPPHDTSFNDASVVVSSFDSALFSLAKFEKPSSDVD